MTGLEALNNISRYSATHKGILYEDIKIVEKELKALEILKDELWFSFSKGFRVFIQDEMKLDEEKYDLLKEVLKND